MRIVLPLYAGTSGLQSKNKKIKENDGKALF
jgi:hypothetical protein